MTPRLVGTGDGNIILPEILERGCEGQGTVIVTHPHVSPQPITLALHGDDIRVVVCGSQGSIGKVCFREKRGSPGGDRPTAAFSHNRKSRRYSSNQTVTVGLQ